MLRSVRLRIYVYANLNVRYIDYLTFASALLTMLKFSIRKRVRILDS